ncbi:Retrovirus-related Pol polyprotein from type-1 retrotransposable element R1 [Eumeta japonica]|uniref:Retrovirus-related Pol polyprotein from type-1 retrotransposable element R1 n=1 Tax=Eumeta variegata TaxID=151549 RepID=A0A4C1SBP0_EUMVA|nr:Retrovirus-related Pol polyprotein from type-1 retrotransposable element R1 [Eumeta japonica]
MEPEGKHRNSIMKQRILAVFGLVEIVLRCTLTMNDFQGLMMQLEDYFTDRKVVLFIGAEVTWKRSTMGCPQGSVLDPTLWNVLLDDLLRLSFPAGVKVVAYADDVTILLEVPSRSGNRGAISCGP